MGSPTQENQEKVRLRGLESGLLPGPPHGQPRASYAKALSSQTYTFICSSIGVKFVLMLPPALLNMHVA